MKTTIAGHRVELYDSLEELPYKLFVEFNIYAIIDAGAGSDLAALDGKLQRVWGKLQTGDTVGAAAEINNFRQGFALVVGGVSPRMLCFAVLVKSIDGRPCMDKSEAGLRAIVDQLSGERAGVLFRLLAELKKKLSAETTALTGAAASETDLRFFKKLKTYGRELADFDAEPSRNWEAELVAWGVPVALFGADNPETAQREAYLHLKLAVAKYYSGLNLDTLSTAEALRVIKELRKLKN